MQPAPDSANPYIAAIVLSYDDRDRADTLRREIIGQGLDPKAVWEVHNPGPRSPSSIEGQSLILSENRGYAGALNEAFRQTPIAAFPFVLIVTHDVGLPPGVIGHLYRQISAHAECGCIGPVLTDGQVPWSVGKKLMGEGRSRHLTAPPQDPFQHVDLIDGSVMLVRTGAIGIGPPFDERLFMYFEETDLCLRLARRAWRIGVATEAVAVSRPGGDRRPLAHAYLMTRNGLEVTRRHDLRGFVGHLRRTSREIRAPYREFLSTRDVARLRRRLPVACAQATGLFHFIIRRFGPPPQALADGDVVL
jgi:GT2 family glycosyltransferase